MDRRELLKNDAGLTAELLLAAKYFLTGCKTNDAKATG